MLKQQLGSYSSYRSINPALLKSKIESHLTYTLGHPYRTQQISFLRKEIGIDEMNGQYYFRDEAAVAQLVEQSIRNR